MPTGRETGQIRRIQILAAAFALAHTNERWSLAEVAERIGVSKTAIYRHFKNRAEIETAMEDEYRNDLALAIENAEYTPDGVRRALVAFYREKPGYLNFFMHNLFSSDGYDHALNEWLKTASPRVASFMSFLDGCTGEKKRRASTAFLKGYVSILIASFKEDGKEALQDDLVEVLGTGLKKMKLPSDRRMTELEKAATIEASEVVDGNRLFDAIAAAIREHGITKTTITNIAEKMGTAKSSLYFYYRNKDEMLGELVKKERDTMIDLIVKRMAPCKTFAEQIFVAMVVQANYLLLKPDMFAVFNWIRYETMRENTKCAHDDFDADRFLKEFHLEEFYPDESDRDRKAIATLKWAATLSTSITLHALKEGHGKQEIAQNIRAMLASMINGDKEI